MKTIICTEVLNYTTIRCKESKKAIQMHNLTCLFSEPQRFKTSSLKPLSFDCNGQPRPIEMPNYLKDVDLKDVEWIGTLSFEDTNISDKEEILEIFKNTKSHPVFTKSKYSTRRMNNVFNFTAWNDTYTTLQTECEFKDYVLMNEEYMERIEEIYEEGDIIVILSHNCWLLPKMIKDKFKKAKIALIIRTNFPGIEMFNSLYDPVRFATSFYECDRFGFICNDDLNRFITAMQQSFPVKVLKDNIVVKKKIIPIEFLDCVVSSEISEHDNPHLLRTKYENKFIVACYANNFNNLAFLNALRAIKYVDGDIVLLLVEINQDEYKDFETKSEIHRIIEYISAIKPTTIIDYIRPSSDAEYIDCMCVANAGLFIGEKLTTTRFIVDYLKFNPYKNIICSMYVNLIFDCERILVNPLDSCGIGQAIGNLRSKVKTNIGFDMSKWDKCLFLNYRLNEIVQNMEDHEMYANEEPNQNVEELSQKYKECKKGALFLDYDGTLAEIAKNPLDAKPTEELLEILDKLADNPKVKLHMVTGRAHTDMEDWIKNKNITISAEHGSYTRINGSWVIKDYDLNWKEAIKNLMLMYYERTPGSHVEEKTTSLCFHYRNCNLKIMEHQMRFLKLAICKLINYDLVRVMEGKCIIEVKTNLSDKGTYVLDCASKEGYDFVILAGDDITDEDMFDICLDKPEYYSIHVGTKETAAKYRTVSVPKMIKLLKSFI